MSFGATYAESRATDRARGHNLNAPAAGVRPDPQFANVVEVISDGSLWSRSAERELQLQPRGAVARAPAGAIQLAPHVDLRKFRHRPSQNNSDGAFTVPASNGVDDGMGSRRERTSAIASTCRLNSEHAAEFQRRPQLSMPRRRHPTRSPPAIDDNGDLVFNDRPVGVGRNSARGSGRWFNSNANFSYTLSFGSAQGRVAARHFDHQRRRRDEPS